MKEILFFCIHCGLVIQAFDDRDTIPCPECGQICYATGVAT